MTFGMLEMFGSCLEHSKYVHSQHRLVHTLLLPIRWCYHWCVGCRRCLGCDCHQSDKLVPGKIFQLVSLLAPDLIVGRLKKWACLMNEPCVTLELNEIPWTCHTCHVCPTRDNHWRAQCTRARCTRRHESILRHEVQEKRSNRLRWWHSPSDGKRQAGKDKYCALVHDIAMERKS